MVLWIAMAALAAAACFPLLASLTRAGKARPRSAPAMAIYRDQLEELDRDLARGIVADSEASAARTEIARRLLREGEAAPDGAAAVDRPPRLAAALIIAMPITALAFYLALGSPQYPDQPLTDRPETAATQEVAQLVGKIEEHLAEKPDDGQGWEVIAPVYAKLGREADAVTAYGNALRLLGSTGPRESDYGEAIVRLNAGRVTPEARAAFERATALVPADPRPKFYLAMALGQEGRKDEAAAAWRALLADAPADAPWRGAAQEAQAALEGGGPSAADVEAATRLAPADQSAMVEGMVASLAERLKAEPNDAPGWARLIRSYMVLGRTGDATAALAEARRTFAEAADERALVEAAAREAGLETGSGEGP
jgi:cytochrome c-type biogenesis protein CcmH